MPGPIPASVVRRARWPILAAILALVPWALLPVADLPAEVLEPTRHALLLGLIGALGWTAAALLAALEESVSARHRIDVEDNLVARRARTRVRVLRQVGDVVIVLVTVAVMLLTFPRVRAVGLGLLGSAGIVGIVVGLAARPTLSNLIAGVQIAITQPIRLEDVVVVEGEWGWIEEIGTTFVVVRVWDQRRLVVPLTRFIEQPFQSWTRRTADLLAPVHLHCDYSVPVDAVREELRRIVEECEAWDGRVANVQVTDAGERTVELRALVSAGTSGDAWNLRCEVREGLVAFLRREHPEALPRTRAEIREADGRPARAGALPG